MPFSRKKKDDLLGWSIFGSWVRYKDPIVNTDGPTSSTNRNHCNGRSWITRDNFLPHMQRTTLNIRLSTAKVLFDSSQVLPCASEELGCEKTSLDPMSTYGTTLITVSCQSIEPKSLTWWSKYYINSGPDLTTKFVFEVNDNPQEHCGKRTDFYPTIMIPFL